LGAAREIFCALVSPLYIMVVETAPSQDGFGVSAYNDVSLAPEASKDASYGEPEHRMNIKEK
jgi:hypothetical protein